MTILPGKQGASLRYPGRVYRRDLGEDLRRLAAEGVRLLVLLVDDDELDRWGDRAIVDRAAAAGVDVVRHPMRDGAAPPSTDAMDAILDRIGRARASGDAAVACLGGVGRTATGAACALVAAGATADEAIARVRAVRHPTAVETGEQIGFVHHYERHVAERARAGRFAP